MTLMAKLLTGVKIIELSAMILAAQDAEGVKGGRFMLETLFGLLAAKSMALILSKRLIVL